MAYGTTVTVADKPNFRVRLAASAADVKAARALRYRVFVKELGSDGALVDHEAGLERDGFDDHCDHLMLIDEARGCDVAGVYRLLRSDQAVAAGRFYSEAEYDLSALTGSGRNLLELGRSCVASEYRGGVAMHHLWQALSKYIAEHRIDILFGVASFHGTDLQALAEPLSLLHHRYLAPEALRTRAQESHFQRMDLMPEDRIDRRRAMVRVPALIKAYLRLGGFVGEGAFVDHAFNTTDVCLIIDTDRMSASKKNIYSRSVGK